MATQKITFYVSRVICKIMPAQVVRGSVNWQQCKEENMLCLKIWYGETGMPQAKCSSRWFVELTVSGAACNVYQFSIYKNF